jgi:predicted alpha/beta-hydrolase family hydrolase
LAKLKTPTLIVQGTRDSFGTREEVSSYTLSRSVDILWLEDGDHDLKPRKSVSGFTTADHLKAMADRVAAWAKGLAGAQ